MGNLPSGLPDHIGDSEPLVRFATQSSHYKKAPEPLAKPRLFMPEEFEGRFELSLFRHPADPLSSLMGFGRAVIPSRPVKGAAIVAAKVLRGLGLQVNPEEDPPHLPRHAAATCWPENPDDAKDAEMKQLEIAMAIAAAAMFKLAPEA